MGVRTRRRGENVCLLSKTHSAGLLLIVSYSVLLLITPEDGIHREANWTGGKEGRKELTHGASSCPSLVGKASEAGCQSAGPACPLLPSSAECSGQWDDVWWAGRGAAGIDEGPANPAWVLQSNSPRAYACCPRCGNPTSGSRRGSRPPPAGRMEPHQREQQQQQQQLGVLRHPGRARPRTFRTARGACLIKTPAHTAPRIRARYGSTYICALPPPTCYLVASVRSLICCCGALASGACSSACPGPSVGPCVGGRPARDPRIVDHGMDKGNGVIIRGSKRCL